MQNRLVHHLIGTELRCALPKCMSVQNYIVNLDLHVHCHLQKYYIDLSGPSGFMGYGDLWVMGISFAEFIYV